MRLIDADALYEAIMTFNSNELQKWCYPCDKILQEIKDAPTIEPSGDLISREEAIDVVCNIKRTDNWQGAVIGLLSALPSADVVSREFYEETVKANHGLAQELCELKASADRPIGEWIRHDDRIMIFYSCSKCGEIEIGTPPYCRGCGAKMKGGNE